MAHLYHMTADIPISLPERPSSPSSGLDEKEAFSASVSGLTPSIEAPDGNPGPERKRKVIVVGAGISGLRAAAVLHRHGVDVVVLDARNRIGGRIHTTHTKHGARDIGAAWMHETSQNKLVKLIPKLGIPYYYDDGLALYYTEFGRAGAQFKAKKVADEFADHVAWYYTAHPDAPDRSVADFVNSFVQDHELISSDERAWAPQAVKEVELWIGTSIDHASSKYLSYFITERNLYMKGGYDGIIGWTAQELIQQPNIIRLNHVADRIVWSDDGSSPCAVRFNNDREIGATLEADAVISTLPLGALRHQLVSFEPELPADIQQGISNFSYGALGKVFFEFAEVFWSKDNDQFIYCPSPLTAEESSSLSSSQDSSSSTVVDSILSHATVTINLWIMTGARELCVQVAEPLTQRVEAMHDSKAIYKFFEPLFKLLRTEPYKALPELLSVETTHWTQDPFAGYGTYSIEKVGDEPEIFIDAMKHHRASRLQFAGEHCTMVANGCVHGAFATGEKAAKNLLDIFNIKYDGGDLVSLDQPLQ